MTWGALLVLGAIFQQVFRFQGALAEIGRNMAVAEGNKTKPISYQNSITPPWLTKLWIGLAVTSIGAVCYLSYRAGFGSAFVGLVALVAGSLISGIISSMLGRPHFETYLHCALHELVNREADYRRDGDLARADAAKHYVWLISLIAGKPDTASESR
jgi:hypothetical protein